MLNTKRDWGRVRKAPDQHGRFRCSMCREWKEPSAFNKNRQQSTGLNYACRQCTKPRTRTYNLAAKYSITESKYEGMLKAQAGRCACCDVEFDGEVPMLRACVDHNHADGAVRDLLCGRCNLAAGNLLDSSDRAQKVALYLKKWNC